MTRRGRAGLAAALLVGASLGAAGGPASGGDPPEAAAERPSESAAAPAPAPGWDRRISAVVSPGPLARAHADLEGVSRCTECHTWLGSTPDAPCLACHEEIGTRMDAALGFHGGFTGSCASCHADHRGVEADLLGLDPAGFAHDQALFDLRGAHVGLECDACHLRAHPETGREAFRPLLWPDGEPGAACVACHESPHGERLVRERGCDACHTDAAWDLPVAADAESGRGFDHDADTRFALDAVHGAVACASCHRPEAEAPPPRTCEGCHGDAAALLAGRFAGRRVAPDPHAGTTRCNECHPPEMARPSLPAYAAVCTGCHPASYASLLATRRALLDEALVAAHPVARSAKERRLVETLTRSGLHHPELAEALAAEISRSAP